MAADPVQHNPSMQMLNESILNHLFVPCHLPNSSEDDYLISKDHQNEYKLLGLMKEFLLSLTGKNFSLELFPSLITCLERWMNVQDQKKLSAVHFQETIDQLVSGDFLLLYFHYQNAAILIEIENHNGGERTLISSWQVLLSTENITSSLLPYFSCFPVATFQLQDRSQLRSIAHCELLVNFMEQPFEYHQVKRGSIRCEETRDILASHYVTNWWINHFSGIKKKKQKSSPIAFKKKHRDQIRWSDALAPFRRSGLWMVLKTIIQTIIYKHFGKSGTIVYKLLITFFLTDIMSKSNIRISNIDLFIQCTRKIARRLNKIDQLRLTIENKSISIWVENVIEEINSRLGKIPVQRNEQLAQRSLPNLSNVNQINLYQHSCEKLKTYLKITEVSTNYNGNASSLTNASVDSIEKSLVNIEISIETDSDTNQDFKGLLGLFERYQKMAPEHYFSENQQSDCFGYSRFILTSLTILRLMHQKLCADPRFSRLSSHAINIPHLFELFEYLFLPNREDMIRARQLYDYFHEFVHKPYPDLLSDITHRNAFGIHFASQSVQMKETLKQIRAEAEQDRQAKREEVFNAKQRYLRLKTEANQLTCQCRYVSGDYPSYRSYWIKCTRCTLEDQANRIKVDIYECPIPEDESEALAVVFELQIPEEIRCYREILWQFINRPYPVPSHSDKFEWLQRRPHASKLQRFHVAPDNCKVKLVSSRKSQTETHYSKINFSESTTPKEFLFPNGLTVEINQTKAAGLAIEQQILTHQLKHPHYKLLQFTVDSTRFQQNRVIAQSIRCPTELKLTEFIEFGSFRSGHHLQWWNLLSALELDSLSFDKESVLLLIIHSLIQYGPVTNETNPLTDSWCPPAHRHLFDDHFLDEFISRLNQRLDECQSNWQNELIFLLVTMITMRVLTICHAKRTGQLIELAFKCRQIGESSIEKISQIFQSNISLDINKIQKLREQIVTIASTCVFTFCMHPDHQPLSDSSIVSFLKAITSIHDNTTLNKRTISMSLFMRNVIRWRDRILISIQPEIAKYLQNTSYQSLHQFAGIYWGMMKSQQYTIGQWNKRSIHDAFDGWYDGQYESDWLSVDLIHGRFLVNGMIIGFLPDEITSDELFCRTFSEHVFEVQPAGRPHTYISKHAYHDHQIHYEFQLNVALQDRVIIRARYRTGDVFQLIPKKYFQNQFAADFFENYSHCLNQKTNSIEFRRIHFRHPEFLSNISYELDLNEGFLLVKNMKTSQILINQSSTFFQTLYKRYFCRLDIETYVYMFRDNANSIMNTKQMPLDCFVHIHLSRLGLVFKYDVEKKKIFSREYSNMYIESRQCFGTLTGLKSGLLLSSTVGHSRRFLVPFGEIQAKKLLEEDHQFLFINRTESMKFAHEYFIFTLNDRLNLLQSSNSPTGWLYLALLHMQQHRMYCLIVTLG